MTCKRLLAGYALVAFSSMTLGCGSTDQNSPTETVLSTSQAVDNAPVPNGICKQAQPKDILIAQLVKDSWLAHYPLTRLSVSASGDITGPALPETLAGDLEIINTVPEARESVARALRKVTGLPEYGTAFIGPDIDACSGVPAWSPNGTVTVNTTANEVQTGGVNDNSWRTTHKEFGQECPLIKRTGNRDIIDPPGDGSTNDPPSATVSATGIRANAYGLCASGTPVGSFCKLSYATGVNWTGRNCQFYYGSLRCVLY